jgi:hypothetical protein
MLARSPDEKSAIEYLTASGAAAISVTMTANGSASVASTFIPRAAITLWCHRKDSVAVIVRTARRYAGAAPDLSTMEAAIMRAAIHHHEHLTSHEIAIGKAAAMAARLDAMVDGMRRDGTLMEFNARFKRGRAAAAAEGRGFMNYGLALRRLKVCLVPMLQSGRPISGVFEQVFG